MFHSKCENPNSHPLRDSSSSGWTNLLGECLLPALFSPCNLLGKESSSYPQSCHLCPDAGHSKVNGYFKSSRSCSSLSQLLIPVPGGHNLPGSQLNNYHYLNQTDTSKGELKDSIKASCEYSFLKLTVVLIRHTLSCKFANLQNICERRGIKFLLLQAFAIVNINGQSLA